MKKCLICVMLISLAIPLCACVRADAPEPAEPQSVPDIESIVEPVAEAEASAESEWEAESEAAYPGQMEAPVSVLAQEQSESIVSDLKPPVALEPESKPEVAPQPESLSALMEALAPDVRLDNEAIEQELLRLINALRDEAGVSALGIEDRMLFASRIRAAEAFESFSHTRPDGTPYSTAFDEAGFSYAGKWHGENLSSLSLSSGSLTEEEIALKMFNGLKSSPGHYRNMTEENFVQAGIGVAVTYTDGSLDVTSAQMFAGP